MIFFNECDSRECGQKSLAFLPCQKTMFSEHNSRQGLFFLKMEITINSQKRNELIDITFQVQELIKNVEKGVCTIFVPHTTAAITINESADPDVRIDILRKLSELIPQHDNYLHSEGNSDAHLKTSLIGSSVQVIIKKGVLVLGTWQAIYFCEFDGPRNRKVLVEVLD
jgi:secondary thiamine-phosphate synthase enzyme